MLSGDSLIGSWPISVNTPVMSGILLFLTSVLFGCRPQDLGPTERPASKEGIQSVEVSGETPQEHPGLHNFMKLSNRIYSGSEPEGETGFARLKALGIKAIVSVDGAKPQLELAQKAGIRYVHIPIGYDGIPKDASASLTRVVKEIQGPLYIHCHHGKHRGPAAAAIACIASNAMTEQEALGVLERAGTSRDYAGLWRDVASFAPPSSETEMPSLVEEAAVDSLAALMATMDRSFDTLKAFRDSDWDLSTEQEAQSAREAALLVKEGFSESSRLLGDEYDEQMKNWLTEAESKADVLLAAVKEHRPEKLRASFSDLEKSCKTCHQKYRDQ